MKNYIIYSMLGDIVNKHIEDENEITHYFLEFSNGEKIALFEVLSEPILKEVE